MKQAAEQKAMKERGRQEMKAIVNLLSKADIDGRYIDLCRSDVKKLVGYPDLQKARQNIEDIIKRAERRKREEEAGADARLKNLDSLDERDNKLLRMIYLQRYSQMKAAAALSYSMNYIAQLHGKALEHLGAVLQRNYGTE